MRRAAQGLALSGLLSLAACWKQGPDTIPAEQARAPVALLRQSAPGPVSYLELSVRAGAACDPPGKEGLASLTAHLLREGGAGPRGPAQVEAELYRLGTDIEVVVDHEQVSFRTRALHEDLPAVASILADMIAAPQLEEATLLRLRGEAHQWLSKGVHDSDETLGLEIFDSWIFAGHPYGHPVAGRAGVVQQLSLTDVRRFMEDRYLRSSMVLGSAGPGAEPEPAVQALREQLSARPGQISRPPTPRAAPPVKGRQMLIIERPGQSTGIHLGHPTELRRDHPDWPAMLLAMTAFGEHRQSHGRLYRALRELRGLNYGDYAYIERYRQSGHGAAQMPGSGRLQNPFYIWLRPVGDENAAFALRAAVALLEELVQKGLSESEFAQIQRYLSARVALWGTDAARRLSWATEARLMGWSEPLATLPAQVAALRREEVNAAIARHLRPADLRIVVVTDDARAFADPLMQGLPTPITYATAPPAAGSTQVEEDQRWSALPLGLSGYDVKPAQDIFR